MGQRDIRRLLIIGAVAVARRAARKGAPEGSWLARMLERKPKMLVASPVGLGPMAPSPVDRSPTAWPEPPWAFAIGLEPMVPQWLTAQGRGS